MVACKGTCRCILGVAHSVLQGTERSQEQGVGGVEDMQRKLVPWSSLSKQLKLEALATVHKSYIY